MTRRRSPRPAAPAFRAALEQVAPKTRLAAVQAAWADVVGERIAAAARPTPEGRDGMVVVCSDHVWAEELDLMQEQLLARLRDRLGEQAPERLQFRAEDGRF